VNTRPQYPKPDLVEGIDLDKLKMVVSKKLWVMVGIFLAINLTAYLTLRWTKDVYESHSELKLEIKQDATALGITQIVEDQNINIVAGEIEQMTSKLFFSRVLDSLDLWVSYYRIGNVLEYEMYHSSPFQVTYSFRDGRYMDIPVYFDFLEGGRYRLRVGESGDVKEAALGEYITLDGGKIEAHLAPGAKPEYNSHFFLTMNSRERLLDFLSSNLVVERINLDANTIRVSLRDFNPLKVYTIVNKVDSIYLDYSNEQKNMANRQKILWLNNELAQVEMKMENFENYFEDFTLKNKSNDVVSDLGKTIFAINKIDSQRFELAKKINELNAFTEDLVAGRLSSVLMPKTYLPPF
jgi:tyrosine-protein kinase Etk/Wzc